VAAAGDRGQGKYHGGRGRAGRDARSGA
jgi:hypothetical protein